MSTLLLRLASPLQSWGIDSKLSNIRRTEREPSKSGVIGLIASALGRQRGENLSDLNNLAFGARADKEGSLLRDYHVARVDGEKNVDITHRYYLADAIFLVGLEGDMGLLLEIEQALKHPRFPLFLGRRSCPPEGQVLLGIREGKSLLEALQEEPWLKKNGGKYTVRLRVVLDKDAGFGDTTIYRKDVPLTFDASNRKFKSRALNEGVITIKSKEEVEICI